jgi:transcriptional regulator with XRE-family HTH domain
MTEDRGSQLNPAGLRKRVGLTQRQVAQALNVRESTVSEWERRLSAPRLRLVKQMLNVYQCSLDELIEAFESDKG